MLRIQSGYNAKGTSSILKKRDEDKNSSNIALQEERPQEQGNEQNNRSKGLDYFENNATNPIKNKPLAPTPNQTVRILSPEEASQVHKTVPNIRVNPNPQIHYAHNNVTQNPEIRTDVDDIANQPRTRSPKINIAQIIKDFKNTAHAIATPEETMDEVGQYLKLIEIQTQKGSPNVKLIQSNLKNAASLLDGYISETLQKDSKVVTNWVDAILLQQVNYSYNEDEINKDMLIKMPSEEKSEEPVKEEPTEEVIQNPVEDTSKELKQIFVNAKKQSSIKEAIAGFKTAVQRSIENKNRDIQSKAHFELGKAYDKTDEVALALDNFNKAGEVATDYNVKSQAYFSMGNIYDEFNKFSTAMDYYVSAIGYAGEADNIKAQTGSLTKLANMFADQYSQEALEIFYEAELIAKDSNNPQIQGFVAASKANVLGKLNKPEEALKSYHQAVENYKEAKMPQKVAANFKAAGELMERYDKKDKAKLLYKRAVSYATVKKDDILIEELNKKIMELT